MNNLYFKKLPENTLFEAPEGICHVNGIHKPINYQIIRNDIYQVEFSDDGGFIHAETIGADDFTDVNVDDYVYLCYDVSYNPIDVPFKVIRAKVTSKADGNNITTDAIYSAYGTIGFVNLDHQNWYLETSIIINTETSSTIESKNDGNFTLNVNVAPFLKIPPITMDDEFNDYPTLGSDNRNFYNKYGLSFLINHFDESNITPNLQGYTTADKFVGLNAVKKIQEKYGNNFFEYFNHSLNAGESVCNLFIAENPTFFRGYPFYYKSMVHIDDELFRLEQYQTLDDLSNDILTLDSEDGYVNIITIDDTLPETKYFNLKQVFVRLLDSEPFDATRSYLIDVVTPCDDNGIYLSWFASNGSRYFWLFDLRYINGISVKTIQDFKPYFSDIETQNATTKDTEIMALPSITVGGYIPRDKFEMVKTILYSINVNMLMNPSTWQDDGVVWQIVRIDKGSTILDNSDDELIDISFTFTKSEINIQSE